MANLDGTNVAVVDSNAGTISKVEGGFLYFKETATGKEVYISLSGNITSLDMTDTEISIFVGENRKITVNTNPTGLQGLISWSGFNPLFLIVNSG